jgi:hypothetical protein
MSNVQIENSYIGLRDEPQSAGGGNCVCLLMQFTVPADRAQQSPKGVGSIEFDRQNASAVYQTQLAHLAALSTGYW